MRHLTKEQIRKLLEIARKHNPKDHLLILVAYNHALRASEAIRLHRSNIVGGKIEIKRLKGSRFTRQPLVSRPDDPLFDEKTLLEACPEGPLFLGYTRHKFYYRMKKYAIEAGIPLHYRNPHILKHSVLKHAIQTGVTADKVLMHAGHKSFASTTAYIIDENMEQASDDLLKAIA